MSEHAETDIRLRFLTFPMKDKSVQRYYIPYDTDDIINTSDAEGSTASEVLTALNTAINDLKDVIAEPFDPTKAYSAGDYVLYEGELYKFTEDHSAGAWTGSDAEQTSIADSLVTLADVTYSTDDIINLSNVKGSNATEALNNLLGNIASTFDPSKDYTEGQLVLYEGILYQFTEDHLSEAWTGDDAEQTTIGEELEPFVAKHYISVALNTSDGALVPWQSNAIYITIIDSYKRVIYNGLYNGQPVTVQVNYGEQYTITANEINGYWNRPEAKVSIAQMFETVVLTYESFDYVDNFPKAKEALNAGADFSAAIGNQLTTTKDDKSFTWDIVDYDSDNAEITLMLHGVVFNGSPYSLQKYSSVFDTRQAVFYAISNVSSGNYFIKIQTGNSIDTFYFTLSKSMPSNSIMFTDSVTNSGITSFAIFLSNTSAEAYETGEFSSTEIAGAIEFTTLVSVFPCSDLTQDNKVKTWRSLFGGNNIGNSVLFKWLNSYASPGDSILPTSISEPFTVIEPGFLNNFTQEDLACLEDADWKCNTDGVWQVPVNLGGCSNEPFTYTIRGKFCVPSRKEIFGTAPADDGSTQFALFAGASANDRIKYYYTTEHKEVAVSWVLRTPQQSSFMKINLVDSEGEIDYPNSGKGVSYFGIAPICKIKGRAPD